MFPNLIPLSGPPTAARLSAYSRPALRAHFAALGADDLYLRFGAHRRAEVIDAYVDAIDFSVSIVLGVFDDHLELVGVAHVGPEGTGWELGLSVLAAGRRRGVGTLLLRRSMEHVRGAGADRITMHCLSVNHKLMGLVKKCGATVFAEDGESSGVILLPDAPSFVDWQTLAEDHMAAIQLGLKTQLLWLRLLTGCSSN